MNICCVVFDMDGTLVNTENLKRELWIKYINGKRYTRESSTLAYDKYNGLPRRKFINTVLVSLGGNELSDDEFEQFNDYLSDGYRPSMATLFPATVIALEKLRDRGLKLFISSGSPQHEVDGIIKYFGLDHLFLACYGSDNGFVKGNEHFKKIAHTTGATRSEMVFIGNDDMDGTLAKEYRIKFFLVKNENGSTNLLEIIEKIISGILGK
ncbi:MAG: HAD family hydrolase [Candidatus Scalindua sp.]|jgi:phosphoglycolate phosphatase-like HAD superfamily hydrolase|nr:HAD family hydrolase [Candidatus Scalindua sp.]